MEDPKSGEGVKAKRSDDEQEVEGHLHRRAGRAEEMESEGEGFRALRSDDEPEVEGHRFFAGGPDRQFGAEGPDAKAR